MSREAHVQFCESLGVRFPGATHPDVWSAHVLEPRFIPNPPRCNPFIKLSTASLHSDLLQIARSKSHRKQSIDHAQD